MCSIFSKCGFSRQIFINVSNIKIHENTSSGNRFDKRGQMDGRTDGEVDIVTELISALQDLRERV